MVRCSDDVDIDGSCGSRTGFNTSVDDRRTTSLELSVRRSYSDCLENPAVEVVGFSAAKLSDDVDVDEWYGSRAGFTMSVEERRGTSLGLSTRRLYSGCLERAGIEAEGFDVVVAEWFEAVGTGIRYGSRAGLASMEDRRAGTLKLSELRLYSDGLERETKDTASKLCSGGRRFVSCAMSQFRSRG